MGVHVFTDRLDFAAADWCFRLHGRPIMPPLSGVYTFTADRRHHRRLVCSSSRLVYSAPLLMATMSSLLATVIATDRCFHCH
jgi:hypothetical protein